MMSRKQTQIFHTDDLSIYIDLATASGWSCHNRGKLFQPIKCTIQIWVVTRHEYEISVLTIPQMSFLRQLIVGFMKCQLSLGSFLVWNYRILQVEYCKVEGEFYERVHALECEFAERFKPLFEKVRRKYIVLCSNELWKSCWILTLVTTICLSFCASVISWYM